MSQPGAGSSGGDNLVPGILLVLALIVGAWFALKSQITHGALWLLRAEAVVVEPVVSALGTSSQRKAFERWQGQLASAPAVMPPSRLVRGLSAGGEWLRWPGLALAVLLAVWVYRRSPSSRYSRTMDFEGLLCEQQQTFPRIRPVMWLKGRHDDKERGAYTWALSPYEFCARHRVIVASRDTDAVRASFDGDRARSLFASQLGETYKSTADLPYHMQILFAAFAARCLDRRRESDEFLDAAGAGFQPVGWGRGLKARWRKLNGGEWSWPAKGPFEIALTKSMDKRVSDMLLDGEKHPRIQAIVQRHHHASSVLAAMLRLARERQGTVTSSDFIWLKAVDRVLHYALNDVGRRVASAEAAGIRSHMQFEESYGKSATPMVESAVESTRKHLDECGWEAPPAYQYDETELAAATAEASEFRLRVVSADAPHVHGAGTAAGGGSGGGPKGRSSSKPQPSSRSGP